MAEQYGNSERFDVPDRSKDEIYDYLEKLRSENANAINKYNVRISSDNYKYYIKASFLFYKLDAEIEIQDNLITINYTTNIPESYRIKAITELKKEIQNITKS